MNKLGSSLVDGIVEVPLELRGPSDEEIIANSEKLSGSRRHRSCNRPSKRERESRRLEQSCSQMKKIATSFAEKKTKFSESESLFVPPMPKISDFPRNEGAHEDLFKKPAKTVSESPKPKDGGRVLKGTLGGIFSKFGVGAKKVTVTPKVEETPVKRGRGRPRKNP